jgi:predicted HTH domain antitoxin
LGKTAELAGKNKEEFMRVLSEHGLDVIRYSKEELEEELKFICDETRYSVLIEDEFWATGVSR